MINLSPAVEDERYEHVSISGVGTSGGSGELLLGSLCGDIKYDPDQLDSTCILYNLTFKEIAPVDLIPAGLSTGKTEEDFSVKKRNFVSL